MTTTPDRWTCPVCHRTAVLPTRVSHERAPAWLGAVQRDHAQVHARQRAA